MKSNFYISFGIWLIIIPFLGIPNLWSNILIALSGLFLVVVFALPIIVKQLQVKKGKKKKITQTNPINPPYIKGETRKEEVNSDNLSDNPS